jgi:hypothetical protein
MRRSIVVGALGIVLAAAVLAGGVLYISGGARSAPPEVPFVM